MLIVFRLLIVETSTSLKKIYYVWCSRVVFFGLSRNNCATLYCSNIEYSAGIYHFFISQFFKIKISKTLTNPSTFFAFSLRIFPFLQQHSVLLSNIIFLDLGFHHHQKAWRTGIKTTINTIRNNSKFFSEQNLKYDKTGDDNRLVTGIEPVLIRLYIVVYICFFWY